MTIGTTPPEGYAAGVARLDRLREFVDRLHPSGLLYATYEHRLIAELDQSRLPRHVAVLADGNRRWARTNAPGQPLVAGYQAGADKLKEFVEWCDEIGIPVVTLWVLSTDNFSRSEPDELEPLLSVIEQMVTDLAATRRWRVHPVGALDLLPKESAERLKAADEDTADLDGMLVNIAVSYGGRHELRDAVRSLLAEEASTGHPDLGAGRDAGHRAHRRAPLHQGPARPGPDHSHLGRAAALGVLDVAVRAQRVLLLRGAVARLPQGGLHPRPPFVRAARAPFRSLTG